jgi:effector-binding domain-containing protein
MLKVLKWLVVASIVVLIGFSIHLYRHLGLQKPVEISRAVSGPLLLLYKDHRGPYHQILPVIREVELWAVKQNVPCPRTFGQYLDDAQAVDQDRLRSRGGCVLSVLPNGIPPEGFSVLKLPEHEYVVARFTGSPAAGPLTVYPAVKKYFADNRLVYPPTVIEIYSINGDNVTTEYLFQLP